MLTLACGGGDEAAPATPPPTRAQRDSMIGASEVIPGAAGVRGALRADSTARARNALRDSLASAP